MVSLADVLDAQAQVESGGNPRARSYKNARGLHQFMPATWRQYGNGKDINDPVANRDAAARYLTDLYNKHGSLPLALAAYNGGDGGANFLRRNPHLMHNPDRKAPINQWRNQTADYVNKIMSRLPADGAGGGQSSGAGGTSNDDEWEDVTPAAQATTQPTTDNTADEWEDVTPQAATAQHEQKQPEYTEGNTVSGDVLHKLGVAGRGVLEGVTGIPASVYNLAGYLPDSVGGEPINLPNALADKADKNKMNTAQYGSSLADLIGLPNATEDDKITEGISKGLGGFVIPATSAAKLGKAGSLIEKVGKFMGGDYPIASIAGTLGGATAQEIARSGGASDNVQLAANIAGNLAGGGMVGMMNMAGRTGSRVANAALNRNEAVAGRVLNRAAGEQAPQVIADLESGVVPSIKGKMIRDYKPTSSEIAGNAGISSILRQSGLDPDTANVLADRLFQNSKAVKDYLEKQAVGSDAYRAAKDAKLWQQVDTVSKPMRTRDLPVDLTPVETAIEEALLKNKGNPAIVAGLEKLKANIPQGGAAGFNEVYNYKQWIDEALRAKNMTDPEIMSLQKAKTAMGQIKTALAGTMTATEPEFKQFLADQAKGVSGLKQRSLAEKIITAKSATIPRVSNTATGQEELYALTGSKLKQVTKDPKVMAEFSPYQRKVFEKAQQHAALEGRDQLGSMVGSNTAQHLNIRDVVAQDIMAAIVGEGKNSANLGKVAGGLADMVTPSRIINARNLSNTGVANILAKAKLDPKYAAQLMKTYGLGHMNFNDSAGKSALRGLMNNQQTGTK